MKATKYIGINLDWDYKLRKVTLSMPDYVQKALHKFRHVPQQHPEHSPHAHLKTTYGQKVQYAEPLDDSEYLSAKEINYVQQVCRTFLYYAIAIDNTILTALSDISSEQAKATKTHSNKSQSTPQLHGYQPTSTNTIQSQWNATRHP